MIWWRAVFEMAVSAKLLRHYFLASSIRLNGVSVCRRNRVKPPSANTRASRASLGELERAGKGDDILRLGTVVPIEGCVGRRLTEMDRDHVSSRALLDCALDHVGRVIRPGVRLDARTEGLTAGTSSSRGTVVRRSSGLRCEWRRAIVNEAFTAPRGTDHEAKVWRSSWEQKFTPHLGRGRRNELEADSPAHG
jgi:hypothetical protein